MKPLVANVIPATNLASLSAQIFSYAVPEGLVVATGMIVKIPFGSRTIAGAVVSTEPVGAAPTTLKPVIAVLSQEPLFTPELYELAQFISRQYLCSLSLAVKMILPKIAPRVRVLKDDLMPKEAANQSAITLNEDQSLAAKSIVGSFGQASTFLLFGVTGSGKTEVYMAAADKALRAGRQILFLVPEIALTPQTLNRLIFRFPRELVAVSHSKISYGQKYLIWKKIHSGEIKILIGPRSSLFAPFKDLGLIAIDEEHDSSYKQSDQNPKFHSRHVAEKLSQLWHCPLILGDATPAVETYYRAEQNIISKLQLPKRIFQDLPKVELVDMREESKAGNFTIFSEQLKRDLSQTLAAKRQAILFINRRGSATSMICKDCGRLIVCVRCSVPVVYHERKKALICHHCERQYDLPALCPHCQSPRLKFQGTGTEKVETEIAKLFPQSRVCRFDRDTIERKADLLRFYRDFTENKFDILVGTQLLAKGWDLEHVGLIGVINADTILNMPDFRSNERTFQLITQVSGRAGRRSFPGKAVFQTYTPDNFAIAAAVNHDYGKFFQQELSHRGEFSYPPFSRLIKCAFKHAVFERAFAAAEDLIVKLKNADLKQAELLGPSPAFVSRIRGQFKVYVIIKLILSGRGPELPDNLAQILKSLPRPWDVDVDPDNLL